MNRWILAGLGEFIGVIVYTTRDEFVGANSMGDIAQMLGFGIPFAAIGFGIGFAVVKFMSPKD